MDLTICHHLLKRKENSPHEVCVQYKKGGSWKEITWLQYYENVESLAAALHELGVKKEDKVAIFSNTRLEWALTDMAVLSLGAVTVPIYPSSLESELTYILNNSESSILVCENESILNKWARVKPDCSHIKKVIVFNQPKSSKVECISFEQLKENGSLIKNKKDFLSKHIKQVQLADLASIVYTSGTTGQPKGVMISHQNIMSEVTDIFNHIQIKSNDISLTFLPFSHILGRVEHWGHIYCGFKMAYAESIERIKQNLTVIRPTFLLAVPRIFEKIYNGVLIKTESNQIQNKIFKWAVKVGKKLSQDVQKRQASKFSLLAQYAVAKKLVFKTLDQALGGRMKFAFCGGAPLSKEIAEFFHASGLLIIEGYGLTETTAGVIANSPFDYKFGTIGKPIGDVEVRFAKDGEILIKSKKVTQGYYKNPEATKEVFDKEAWFATGDIGEIDSEGFIRITDRKKDLIKTAGGKFVAPQKIENLFKLSNYISNVLIHGDKKKYIVALICLNLESIRKYAEQHSIPERDLKSLSKNPIIISLIRDVVAEVNSHLASFETVKNFSILDHDFTIEDGQLTPSLKVKRKYCDQRYADIIEKLYN